MLSAHLSEPAKHAIDYFSVGAFVATLIVDFTPLITGVTALLTAVWIVLRIIEGFQSIKLNHRKLRGDQ